MNFSPTLRHPIADSVREGVGSLRGAVADEVWRDPAFIAPVVVSALALCTIAVAAALCLRRREWLRG